MRSTTFGRRLVTVTCVLLVTAVQVACASGAARTSATGAPVPFADYHQHLFTPAKAKAVYEPPLPAIGLPGALANLVAARERAWDDSAALAPLYADDALLLNTLDEDYPTWMRGRANVAREISQYFESPYRITPVAYTLESSSATVAGYYTRGAGDSTRHFGHVLLALEKSSDGRWRIQSETPTFPGPPSRAAIDGASVVRQLDDAGIRRAVVLSVAYQWGSPWAPKQADEYAQVREENDFVASEVALHPDRLVGFCSFNPLKDYALPELERCARQLHMTGLKLHLGNSQVDVRRPEQAEKLRAVFADANRLRMPIVIHMWTSPAYEKEGGQHARAFLDHVLPAASDIPVQIAHMAGGGRSTDSALAVFAAAIQAKDPRTRHLYFDVATLTAGQTRAGLEQDARRMRQIGMSRILYGTDSSPPNPPARISWATFRALMPLTDEEFRIIAGNMTPYVR
jgi:predicted TIM-barrel fold metal-dependent hydrolase